MNRDYSFVKCGKFYFPLKPAALRAYVRLYFSNAHPLLQDLGLDRPQVLRALKNWLLRRWRTTDHTQTLRLPRWGHLSVTVHRGQKIFDLNKGRVTKAFDQDVPRSVREKEIRRLNDANRTPYASELLYAAPDSSWYEEELVAGSSATRFPLVKDGEFTDFYVDEIEPCLQSLFKVSGIESLPWREYVDGVYASIVDERHARRDSLNEEYDDIYAFLQRHHEILQRAQANRILCVFSHGDFSTVNMVVTASGLKVLDWESASLRSVLNDLYNCFFTEMYYDRLDPKHSRLEDVVGRFLGAVEAQLGEHNQALRTSVDAYRACYYLERIGLLLEREHSARNLHVIRKSVRLFSAYKAPLK